MKRSRSIAACILAFAAMILASCATKAPVSAQNPLPAAESQAKASPKAAKQRTVIAKFPVLVKETSMYSDGLVDEFIVYKMDAANKNLIEKATFDASRPDPIERLVPEYKDGRLASESLYETDGKLRLRRELGYDAAGNLVSERVLDAGGKVQSSSAYAYDADGRKTEWRALDGAGSVKAISSYSYGKKDLIGVEMKDSGGKTTGAIKLEYSDGALAKRSYFGADKALQKYEAYVYAGGRLSALEYRRADASLSSKMTYEYGPSGELVKSAELDSSGALKGYSVYEYVVREDSSIETYYE